MRNPLRQSPAARCTRRALAWFTTLSIGMLAFQAAQAAPVPDFKLQLLDGKTTSLQNHRGRPILINFFYSK